MVIGPSPTRALFVERERSEREKTLLKF
ncbi:hypothetical protein MPNT_270002 [Candidatus Methylacidithermus pantelleriae]|uniref:Uncharacterized protein n=1 Tax=Candidatus Methylacidithermus pantelleriae TaxID=2744239 RepID=A0A8J2FSS0_9BACT|nr:hypothetical protein MPNT_270002 [Candidatus Methylacidithermus pantelleriae]